MAAQRENRVQRQEAIIEILMEKKGIGSQAELGELLKERGFDVTQSSISRDLQEIGVRRVKGRYVLQPWKAVGHGDFERVAGFIQGVAAVAPNLVIVHTSPGAARVVAWAIDSSGWPEAKGSVAGEDTIFVAVENIDMLQRLYRRIGHFL